MKKNTTLLVMSSLLLAFTSNVFANVNDEYLRINAANVEVGYNQYRDNVGCPSGDCWDEEIPFIGTITYKNSFSRTYSNNSCTVNGNVKTCYYQFNVDGSYVYIR